jgi:alanine racemase
MLYQTHARIHLANIRRNLSHIRAFLGPGPRLLFAVKANGYGHDAVAVATMAEREGLADWFGVSTVPEGLELREAGVERPILKFSPSFPEELGAALEGGLTLAVAEPTGAQALEAACAARGVQARVHLKLDTGMGRTGIPAEEAGALTRLIRRTCPALEVEGVFTHLSVADQAQEGDYTRDQIRRFQSATETVAGVLGRMPELIHCASSGAILSHPESWFTMVRVGSIGYGYYPLHYPDRPLDLVPGLSLLTRISFLKKVRRGASIGYGRTWKAPVDTWIATLPVGFADGFDRLLSNRGRVLWNGRYCPVVGLVCMDQCMIDLGPATTAQVGDEVVLIGRSGDQEITTTDLAESKGSIPCEITCQIGPRVPRVADAVAEPAPAGATRGAARKRSFGGGRWPSGPGASVGPERAGAPDEGH